MANDSYLGFGDDNKIKCMHSHNHHHKNEEAKNIQRHMLNDEWLAKLCKASLMNDSTNPFRLQINFLWLSSYADIYVYSNKYEKNI